MFDYDGAGAAACENAFDGIVQWLSSFVDKLTDINMPGALVDVVVGLVGAFVVFWGLWAGFKALRRAFSRAAS